MEAANGYKDLVSNMKQSFQNFSKVYQNNLGFYVKEKAIELISKF